MFGIDRTISRSRASGALIRTPDIKQAEFDKLAVCGQVGRRRAQRDGGPERSGGRAASAASNLSGRTTQSIIVGDASVLEVIESQAGDAYRAVYTVRFAAAVVVLDVFQKKSKSGIETPRPDMDLIEDRLKKATVLIKASKT